LLEIAAETTNKLTEKQEQLKQCKWTDGESNTDTDFSELACKCAEEAWLCVKQNYPLLSVITMAASIPDIICTFSKNGKTIKVPKKTLKEKISIFLVLIGMSSAIYFIATGLRNQELENIEFIKRNYKIYKIYNF
jgi:hypothetical protein